MMKSAQCDATSREQDIDSSFIKLRGETAYVIAVPTSKQYCQGISSFYQFSTSIVVVVCEFGYLIALGGREVV